MASKSIDELVGAMHLLYDASPDPTVLTSAGKMHYVNNAFATAFCLASPSEAVGRFVREFVAAQDWEIVNTVSGRPPGTSSARYRSRGVRPDGSEMAVEVSRAETGHGDAAVISLQLAVDDFLSTPNHENQLYHAMFEANSAIKLLVEPTTGQIVDANHAAIEFYGWPLEQMRKLRIRDINRQPASASHEKMQEVLTGERRYFRFWHRLRDGSIRNVEVHSGVVKLGERRLLMSIIQDVTARDELEQHLRMSQRLEAVGRLAGSVAHEFNNLLTVTLTASTALLRSVDIDSNQRGYVEDIAFASQRAAVLTRELLVFSRRQHMKPQAVDLNLCIAKLVSVLSRAFGKSTDLVLELGEDLPRVRVDPQQLEHVLMNLVLNARAASPPGSSVAVRTELTTLVEMSNQAVPAGTWLLLSVTDVGHGMDDTTLARLFEPMFTTKPEGEGTGIGMATVYGIVTQGGGYITVETALGEGTKIGVYLPVAEDNDLQESADVKLSVPMLDSLHIPEQFRVLVVDDLESVRVVMARGLTELGYSVIEASSAEEALTIAGSLNTVFDAVVSDIQMPGKSGIELATELLSRQPGLPVLLVSGALQDRNIDNLGAAVKVLHKPFTLERLGDELAKLLTTRNS